MKLIVVNNPIEITTKIYPKTIITTIGEITACLQFESIVVWMDDTIII